MKQPIPMEEAAALLDLEGAPPISEAFEESARLQGMPEGLDLAMHALYHTVSFPVRDKTGVEKTVYTIPGHTRAGQHGPAAGCPVMVIGNMPNLHEASRNRVFTGPAGAFMWSRLDEMEVDTEDWYVTNLVKFPPPIRSKEPKKEWVDACAWLLHQEIALVKPKVLFLLGSVVIKALLGKGRTLTKCRGSDQLFYNGIPVVVGAHPYQVIMDPLQKDNFLDDLKRVQKALYGAPAFDFNRCDYRVIEDEKTLSDWVDWVIEKDFTWHSVDCEWGSNTWNDYINGELRSVQVSIAPFSGVCVALRGEGLTPRFSPSPEAAIPHLKRLLERPRVRLLGHNLRADMKWLVHRLGFNLERQYLNGFDTASAYHLMNPSQGKDVGLDKLAVKFTEYGKYDWFLEEWLSENKFGRDKMSKYGYAFVPPHILDPYSIIDVDVTMQLMPIFMKALQEMELTGFGPYEIDGQRVTNLYEFHQAVIHPVGLALDDLEVTGFPADRARMIDMVELFHTRQAEMLEAFREEINWPTFNHRAVNQVRELLFGFSAYNQIAEEPEIKATAKPFLQPEDAVCFYLDPVKTTEKPSRDWGEVPPDELPFVSPSTDAESLQILAAQNPLAKKLSDIKIIDQMIKNFLRAADEGKDGEELLDEETGEPLFTRGLVGSIDGDGRIRTNISLFTDTGRYRSSDPNLQNLPKKQEAKLKEIFCPDIERLKATPKYESLSVEELKALGLLHPRYYPLRTCFVADPGHLLIEADYVQAELNVLAWLSQDDHLMEVMSDKKRDLHSEIAVKGLNLPCGPHEVKKLYPTKRDGAKATVYGLLYGRGLAAVVRQMQQMGIMDFTEKEAAALKEALFGACPRVEKFIRDSHAAVYNPGYVENPFGRRRYFPETDDKRIRAEQQRQAVNMPIQGTVADVLSVALYNLYRYKNSGQPDVRYQVLVPVHDAVILHVPVECAQVVKNEVLPLCMKEWAPVPHIGLKLDIDIEATVRWGQKMKFDQAVEAATTGRG